MEHGKFTKFEMELTPLGDADDMLFGVNGEQMAELTASVHNTFSDHFSQGLVVNEIYKKIMNQEISLNMLAAFTAMEIFKTIKHAHEKLGRLFKMFDTDSPLEGLKKTLEGSSDD